MCSGTTSPGRSTMPSGNSGKRSTIILRAYAPRNPSVRTSIVWFTRDLRVHDHPALRAAVDSSDAVIPVFCLDDRLLHGRHASGPRTQFMLECLADLDESLRERGGRLVVRRGQPGRELSKLAEETGATAVHFTKDVSPHGRRVE